MTDAGVVGLTIEMRPSSARDGRGDAFATVLADGTTFDEGVLTAWRDGVAVARYRLDSVAGLRFGMVPTAGVTQSVTNGRSAQSSTDAATVTHAATATGTDMPLDLAATSVTTDGRAAWTPGEDSLLRTLSDQHAGLTMMILKTKRPMDEVMARLAELGIDPAN